MFVTDPFCLFVDFFIKIIALWNQVVGSTALPGFLAVSEEDSAFLLDIFGENCVVLPEE